VLFGYRGLPSGSSLARLLDQHRPRNGRSNAPWTPEEDEFVQTLSPAEAAQRTERSLFAVYQRRRVLRIRPIQQ
jgi:hypothetical protein